MAQAENCARARKPSDLSFTAVFFAQSPVQLFCPVGKIPRCLRVNFISGQKLRNQRDSTYYVSTGRSWLAYLFTPSRSSRYQA
jgi:hypothetical protein